MVIPARAGSKRLPMKPLRMIAGRSLLHRTIAMAHGAMSRSNDVRLIVATDDARIADHAAAAGCDWVMTDSAISSGSGRALAAAAQCPLAPSIVVNLQGDAPFQPPTALSAVIAALAAGDADVATPVTALDWTALDALRLHKQSSPFSGTTCVRAETGRALWFSKTILPAMRDEAAMRARGDACPVLRHVGLYAYRYPALAAFEAAPMSPLERLEGLEQLRLFELGLSVDAVMVAPGPFDISGIDTPADIALAETLIAVHGDPTPP